VFSYLDKVAKDASPCPPPDPVRHVEIINNIYRPEVTEKVLFGVISPEEGVKILRVKASELLAKN
jgi:hypothetical protein